jgi:hypothetical protein
MRFTPTTGRLVRAGGLTLSLLLASLVSGAQTAGAQPTPPGGGGGGITTPEPCIPEFQDCGPTDPCEGDMPPEDCPVPCENGEMPVDGECPVPCENGEMPVDGECPVPCEDGQEPVDGECPPPLDPCFAEEPPEECNDNTPDPGGHGTVDQPVPGTPTFTG